MIKMRFIIHNLRGLIEINNRKNLNDWGLTLFIVEVSTNGGSVT